MVEEAARQEVLSYVREVRLACEQPLDAKPPPSFWESNEKLHMFTESLKSYALELCRQPLQKKGAEEVRSDCLPSVSTSVLEGFVILQ